MPWQMIVVGLAGWGNMQPLAVIQFLEENRALGEPLRRKRLRFTDAQRGTGSNTRKRRPCQVRRKGA